MLDRVKISIPKAMGALIGVAIVAVALYGIYFHYTQRCEFNRYLSVIISEKLACNYSDKTVGSLTLSEEEELKAQVKDLKAQARRASDALRASQSRVAQLEDEREGFESQATDLSDRLGEVTRESDVRAAKLEQCVASKAKRDSDGNMKVCKVALEKETTRLKACWKVSRELEATIARLKQENERLFKESLRLRNNLPDDRLTGMTKDGLPCVIPFLCY